MHCCVTVLLDLRLGGGPSLMILMFRPTVVVLHALPGLGMLIHRPDNSGSVVVTNPRLPLARSGGYWGPEIFCRAIVISLSSLPGGVVMFATVLLRSSYCDGFSLQPTRRGCNVCDGYSVCSH